MWKLFKSAYFCVHLLSFYTHSVHFSCQTNDQGIVETINPDQTSVQLVPQVVVNLLFLKSRPSVKKRILGMTKSRLGQKNVNLALIVKKKQEILRPEQIALISKKKGTLAFVQVAEHPEKVEMLNVNPIPTNLGLLKETMKALRHEVSATTALLVGKESLMATAPHEEPMVMPQDLTANVHRMENENLIAIVHHVKQTVILLDHIPNAHLAVKELPMEIVRHAEQMAKGMQQEHIKNAVLLENAPILKH
jgi:hypothetical protein